MRTHKYLAAALTVFAAAACNPFHHDQAVQVSAQDANLNSRWHANLASPAELAGAVQMNGSATMAPGANNNSTNVTLDVGNASPGGLHPWEVHEGQCGSGMDNGVFGPSAAYKPLKVGNDGHANGTAAVPLQTPSTGNYFVEIHASVANPDVVIACGNLAPPTQ